jgi:hypothetical protein
MSADVPMPAQNPAANRFGAPPDIRYVASVDVMRWGAANNVGQLAVPRRTGRDTRAVINMTIPFREH